MIEKIDIGKCLSELPDGNAGKIVGTSGTNGVLTTPAKVTDAGGCGVIELGRLSNKKWYRIAIGTYSHRPSSALFNIGKNYATNIPTSQLFYAAAFGYNTTHVVSCLANAGKGVGKARILYQNSTTEKVILDIYISSLGENAFTLSYSNNIGFVFQSAVEVPEATDAGYLVKEFTF